MDIPTVRECIEAWIGPQKEGAIKELQKLPGSDKTAIENEQALRDADPKFREMHDELSRIRRKFWEHRLAMSMYIEGRIEKK